MPFLRNANMLIQFLLLLFSVLPFVFRFTSSLLQLCVAPTGGMRYSAHCLSEPKDHLSARLNVSLSETMQVRQRINKALLLTAVPL